ncbi:MAG: glycosyltransferase family 4 protein, partial [Anaerolineales bacterium]|nr:glycosyltransferase family 4 protein [Anaerolineales bacterium]
YPYSCAEAMACGACVVASKIGGLDEMISDGETGYLFPPGDSLALAQVIMCLLARPDKRKYVGANSRAAVQERMNPDKVTAQTIEIYHQVLA